ncbi:small subunit ribosomal protein S1 [Caldicellulosiruptor bescii]|uniref:RNA binding S1 domain protein n=2 Tax=Caldicellulosiruptor bescii TaxID=31899 RepID=B9MP26_CALBD|nr:S1 RNA-binding domain-containing protein [Caldicellulosiruptor bescii]ACM61585.1 RNA binding S1 domain protein [Caldicellulosiruptor bescii DSM 6725]PBC88606.1 small subunit ribosomal protein S1 [Caldicellulosiruptor bescii]PBC91913.1 small subunit ribosomal protein S1 [Caldicellulosiruptor bescii]PBD02676.1 small subunit ribosomal protein S1 [Caldicellulosiruptor bescii]PBD07708.1 small subunit ribosomal protein S1 [Caldicellulosiruptor bescii]
MQSTQIKTDKRIYELQQALKTGRILLGEVITKEQQNGKWYAVVKWKGLRLYCDEAELGLQEQVKNKADALLGALIEFVVIAQENGRFYISRVKAMEKRRKIWEKVKEGDIVEGRITGVTPRNAFIEVLGYEFALPAEEMLWNYTNDLRRHFKIADRVKAKVISKDPPKISVKQAYPNPWDTPPAVTVGQVIVAPVDAIAHFGFLVKLDDGKQCLCPPYSNAREIPTIGTRVVVQIQSIDLEKRRIFGTIQRILR